MFVPTLVEVPIRVPLQTYQKARVPILDQGVEGACTGFALATVVHYLLHQRKVVPDRTRVSPRMLYEMARRYDEWPGETYSGSSARGAMKGWHKHGVRAEKVWPYSPNEAGQLTDDRASDALRRPLGAYFRVNHRDLVAMHSAISEVGILYATGMVHDGWMAVPRTGLIEPMASPLGGHAFAIVGYDERGFWIQNSWGKKWGHDGFGLVSYDDWMKNGTDVWAARVGAPVILNSAATTAAGFASAPDTSRSYVFCDLRAHIISLGNNGRLRTGGNFGTSEQDVREILEKDLPRLTAKWKTPRLLLYAHGGLVSEDEAVQRLADYRPALIEQQIYPLALIWKTDYFTTIGNAFEDRLRIPLVRPGVPLLGLEKSVDAILTDTINRLNILLARSPNAKAETDSGAARARQHVDFDDDEVTLQSTLRFILNRPTETTNALVLHSLDRTRKAQRLRFSAATIGR
jgi:hypothetical protein